MKIDQQWFDNNLKMSGIQINALAWGKDAPTTLLERITYPSHGITAQVFNKKEKVMEHGITELQEALRQVIITPDNVLTIGKQTKPIKAGRHININGFQIPSGSERILLRFDCSRTAIARLKKGRLLPDNALRITVNGITLSPQNAHFYHSISPKLKIKHAHTWTYKNSLVAVSYILPVASNPKLSIQITNNSSDDIEIGVEALAAREHFPQFKMLTPPKRVEGDGTPAFCRNDTLQATVEVLSHDETPFPLRSVSYQLSSANGHQSTGNLVADDASSGHTKFRTDAGGIRLLEGTNRIDLLISMAEGSSMDTMLKVHRRIKVIGPQDPRFILNALESRSGPLPDPQTAAAEQVSELSLCYSPFDSRQKISGFAPAYSIMLDPDNPCFRGPQGKQTLKIFAFPATIDGVKFGTIVPKIVGLLRKDQENMEAVNHIEKIALGDMAIVAFTFTPTRKGYLPLAAILKNKRTENKRIKTDGCSIKISKTIIPVAIDIFIPIDKMNVNIN